jgi:hypothetical protein
MTGRSVDRLKVIKHGISSAPWIRSPAVYVDVLFNLTDINPMNADAIASLLYEISNPYCGNPTGTLTVLRMMESLEGKIKKVLGQKSIMMDELDYHRAPGSSIRGSAMASSKASRASLAVSHRFKKIFDSDILNDVGYDFLGGARKKGIGVRQLSIERFKTRALLENQKYFKSEAASGAGEGEKASRLVSSRLSYLSPAIVSTGRGESYNMLRNPFHFDQKRAAVAAILSLKPDAAGAGKDKLNPNTGFGSSYDASRMRGITKEEMKENIMNSLSLAKLGVTFMDPDEFDKRHSFEAEKNQNSKRRSRKVEISTSLGALSKASTDKIEVEDNMTTRGRTNTILERDDLSSVASEILSNFSRSDKELFSDPKIKTIDAFDLNNNQHNIVSRFLNVRKDKTLKDVMKKMPNQIRSLFLSDTPITNKHWIKHKEETGVDIFKSSIHSAMIYFNYEMLNRIEVFKGFKKSRTTGEMMLREPRFVLITEEDLISAREKGHTLICRMRPYHNAMLGFGHKPRLSLPVFDEHFLISPLKSRADDESLPSSVSPYIDRISDPARLNKTGTSALQRIVETSMLENVVMSEYLATVTVQQTNDVTKFGTKFGGKLAAQSTAPAIGSNPRDVLRSLSDGSPTPSAANDQRASTEEFVGRKKGTGMGGDY